MTCRCGHDLTSLSPHPCHAHGYTCRKPATRRFYYPFLTFPPSWAVSGEQLKVPAEETWACDEHWREGEMSPYSAVTYNQHGGVIQRFPIAARWITRRGGEDYVMLAGGMQRVADLMDGDRPLIVRSNTENP